jgi:predicted transcriptional regulator
MNKTKISVRIPERLGKDIEAIAANAGRSKASILTEALEAYIWRQTWLQEEANLMPTSPNNRNGAPG